MATGFSVFVNIGGKLDGSLSGAVSGVDRQLARLEARAKHHASAMSRAYSGIHTSMSKLGAMAAGGGAMMGLKHAIGQGSSLEHETQALRNVGRGVTEVAEALNAANAAIKALPTTTLAENLKLINETTGAFGSFDHAVHNLQFNQRVASVLKNTVGDAKMGDSGEMFNQIVRALEIRGSANDDARYQSEVRGLAKAMIFTHGKVNPHEFLNFAQQANPAIKNLSERFMTTVAPSMIQEFGGERAGTRLQAFQNVLMGKVRDRAQTAAWLKYGLLNPNEVVGGKKGEPFSWKAGAVQGTDLALTDPDKWAEEVALPALQKAGVQTENQLELTKALATMFRNNEANRFANAIMQVQDRKRLQKDAGLIAAVHDPEQIYKDNLKNDPTAAWTALKASLDSFQQALTSPLMAAVAPALTAVAEGIQKLAGAMQENPGLAAGIGAVALALTGLAAIKFLEMAAGIVGVARGLAALAATKGVADAAGAAGAAAGVANDNVGAFANDNVKTAGSAAAGSALGAASMVTGTAVVGAGLAAAATGIAQQIVRENPEMAKSIVDNPMLSAMSGDMALGLAVFGQDAGKKAGEGLKEGVESSNLTDSGKKLGEQSKSGLESVDMTSAGTALGEKGKQGLSSVDMTAAGTALGEKGKQGLLSVDYTGAGAQAGSQLVTGFRSAISGAGLGIAIPKKVDGARAAGGPVSGGRTYLVGENGPELFSSSRSGRIATNASYQRMLEAASDPDVRGSGKASATVRQGDTNTFHVHVQGGGDPQETARVARREIERFVRQREAGQRNNLSD